ncbi:hypothetical protein ERO13_A06G064000v2 [Gossypium hirsutum]|nr:hypothetical protein ERO13_A06G064000v2 [Gossypium hirsutum]
MRWNRFICSPCNDHSHVAESLERWLMQLWRPICTVRSYIFIAQMIRSFRITLSPFLYCQNPNRCDL